MEEEAMHFYNIEEEEREKRVFAVSRAMRLLELRGEVHAGLCKIQPYVFTPTGHSGEISTFSHFEAVTSRSDGATFEKINAQDIPADQEDLHLLLVVSKELKEVKERALNTQRGVDYFHSHPPDFRDARSHGFLMQLLHNLVVWKQEKVFANTLQKTEISIRGALLALNTIEHDSQIYTYGFPLGITPKFSFEEAMDELKDIRETVHTCEETLSQYLS